MSNGIKAYANLQEQRELYEWCRANAPALLKRFDGTQAPADARKHVATFSAKETAWMMSNGAPWPN